MFAFKGPIFALGGSGVGLHTAKIRPFKAKHTENMPEKTLAKNGQTMDCLFSPWDFWPKSGLNSLLALLSLCHLNL